MRAVGWIYLAIGAFFLAAMFASSLLPVDRSDDYRGEWSPMVLPFLLLFPIAFTFAGYHVLRQPPLYRRRSLLLGFIALTCGWLAWMTFRQ